MLDHICQTAVDLVLVVLGDAEVAAGDGTTLNNYQKAPLCLLQLKVKGGFSPA
jgi:hypothetical protein